MRAEPKQPRLRAPDVDPILAAAAVKGPVRGTARSAMLAAMRKAAAKRVEGVTKHKRRKRYGHAAQLVATCDALDPSPSGDPWVAGLRSRYSRYPALQGELEAHLGRARDVRKRLEAAHEDRSA